MNRGLGLASIAAMLLANAALFTRDILPGLYAGDPPQSQRIHTDDSTELVQQVGIFLADGLRVGRSWSSARDLGEIIQLSTITVLNAPALGVSAESPELAIYTTIDILDQRTVDSIALRVLGLGFPMRLRGERVSPFEFPCEWEVGPQRGETVLPTQLMNSFGDPFQPFGAPQDVTVGQVWKIQTVSPFSLMSGDGQAEFDTRAMLVRVAAEEYLEHDGAGLKAFRLESDGVTAWVTRDGWLVKQVIELPIIGRITLLDEPYDRALHNTKRRDRF